MRLVRLGVKCNVIFLYYIIAKCCENLAIFCASVKAGNSEKNERKKDKGKSTFKSDRITVEGEKGGFTFPSIGYED